jgi:hypothetical protein
MANLPVFRASVPSLSNGTFIARSPVPDARVKVAPEGTWKRPAEQQTACRAMRLPSIVMPPSTSRLATAVPPNPIPPPDQ